MNFPDFQQQLCDHLYLRFDYRILHWTPVAGSTINRCYKLTVQDNGPLFVKYQDDPPEHFYQAEELNLQALSDSGQVRAPEVIEQLPNALVLRWIDPGPPSDSAQYKLGVQLANLHNQPVSHFGFNCDNFCGRTPQQNQITQDGFEFFIHHRLLQQGTRAFKDNYLTRREFTQLEALCERLKEWIPVQQPALLHGDLWAGNFMVDSDDNPWLIDPACYWGWPEADLAMTKMFGGFSEAFYQGYSDIRPIDNTMEERLDLYNLYHWLNHLNMFGSQYHSAVSGILRRFAGP